MNGRSLRGQGGFTLIELLVAVVLITVAMLLGGRFTVQQLQQVSVSEAQSQARGYAIEKLERLKLLPIDSITAQSPQPVPEAPRYLRSVQVMDVGGGNTDLYSYRLVTVQVQPPSQSVPPVEVSTAVGR